MKRDPKSPDRQFTPRHWAMVTERDLTSVLFGERYLRNVLLSYKD